MRSWYSMPVGRAARSQANLAELDRALDAARCTTTLLRSMVTEAAAVPLTVALDLALERAARAATGLHGTVTPEVKCGTT